MWPSLSLQSALGLAVIFNVFGHVAAQVTIYYVPGQEPLGTGTASGSAAAYTGAAAYDPTVLTPPPLPNPPINTKFPIELQTGNVAGLSIPQRGSFFGFSIEMSVTNQILGKNSTQIYVPFLNFMSNLIQRGGAVNIRVGGNTQETAVLVDQTSDGRMLEKNLSGITNPTQTPPLIYTRELLYLMGNISSLINVRWNLGVPMLDVNNLHLEIIEVGQKVLGDNLIGLQVGNEPDLYVQHQHRPTTYGPADYSAEFGIVLNGIKADPNIQNPTNLIGPSIATFWTLDQVYETGFVEQYTENLGFIAVERYPADNCFARFNVGTPTDPQQLFQTLMSHSSPQGLLSTYANGSIGAQEKGKPILMMETNTASCGGFAGLSNSFGAALWSLDWAMQLAYGNFSGSYSHLGGQNVFYNAFTPPPTNQSTFHQWSVGPTYYSALVTAEAMGLSNKSQILDLGANNQSQFTPAYAIYEDGIPVRLLAINYISDPPGTNSNTITMSISIGGGQTGQPNATPASVRVKYLAASSVSQTANFTWAGQTFGSNFATDGRFMGTEEIQTVSCDQTANACAISIPAPGAALVFLTDTSVETSTDPVTTFPTTALTKTVNTVSVDPSVLATSNGHTGEDRQLGSTSPGSANEASGLGVTLRGGALMAVLLSGALVLLRGVV